MPFFYPKRKGTGFTLVEILLVALILSIIAGLAIPSFSSTYAALRLKKTAEELVLLMRYAQNRAITKNRLMRLEFDGEFSSYRLTQSEALTETAGTQNETFKPVSGSWGKKFFVPGGIKVTTKKESVTIYPDGSLEKIEIDLCNRKKCFIVSTEGKRRAIQLFESDADESRS